MHIRNKYPLPPNQRYTYFFTGVSAAKIGVGGIRAPSSSISSKSCHCRLFLNNNSSGESMMILGMPSSSLIVFFTGVSAASNLASLA